MTRPPPETSAHPLAPYGWNDRVAQLVAAAGGEGLRPARVARVDRGALTAVTAAGIERVAYRDLDVTTGDWVLLGDAPSAVAEVLPRWSALRRSDPGGTAVTQLLAANIDVGFAVVGLDRERYEGRLNRLLTLIWSSGATPVVVLAKCDLVPDPQAAVAEVERDTVGVEVVATSSLAGQGIGPLRVQLPAGRTAVVIGESGAGKSSLVNALIGADVQAVGDVRRGDFKGRHTTRARELVALPGGGVLLDTPGIRAVALTAGQGEGLDRTFADVVALAGGCRFADCSHDVEPGCAVQRAVDDGRVDAARLESFRALQREVASAARRADERADRQASRRLGRQYKQVNDLKKRSR